MIVEIILGVLIALFLWHDYQFMRVNRGLDVLDKRTKRLHELLKAQASHNIPPHQNPFLPEFDECQKCGTVLARLSTSDNRSDLWFCPKCKERYILSDQGFEHVFGYPSEGGNNDN